METILNLPVAALLPHAAPMVLLERVVTYGEDWLIAAVDLGRSNILADGIGVPAYATLEYMAQAISAYAGIKRVLAGQQAQIGFLLGTSSFESLYNYLPDQGEAFVRIDVVFAEESLVSLFDCHVYIAGEEGVELARASLKVFQPDDANALLKDFRR